MAKLKNLILRWAECLKELQQLGEYEKPVSTICNTIAKEMTKVLQDTRGSKYAYKCYNEIMR
jgi:hypothetical protein